MWLNVVIEVFAQFLASERVDELVLIRIRNPRYMLALLGATHLLWPLRRLFDLGGPVRPEPVVERFGLAGVELHI